MIPFSVIIDFINLFGVTSNAGLYIFMSSWIILILFILANSVLPLYSIGICDPLVSFISIVLVGAAT